MRADTPTLAGRIVAPDVLPVPEVDGVTWRGAALTDVDALTALIQASDRRDHPSYLTTRDEVAEDLEASWIDPATDYLVGMDATGTPIAVGQAHLTPSQETLARVILIGTVHPEWRRRGIGHQLLAWQEARGLQVLATIDRDLPGWLLVYAEESTADATAMLDRAGFTVARHFFELTRDLSEPIATVDAPEGIRIVPFDPDRAGALRVARNDAFRDHWSSQSSTTESWARFMAHQTLRFDLSFLALTPKDEIAGFVVTEVNPADWPGQGFSSAYVDLVGVPRAWRGRGIASALLTHALGAFAREGLDRAVLDVDSESPTGAVGLYSRVGFIEASRNLSFLKVF